MVRAPLAQQRVQQQQQQQQQQHRPHAAHAVLARWGVGSSPEPARTRSPRRVEHG
jgi:hypothetical protein